MQSCCYLKSTVTATDSEKETATGKNFTPYQGLKDHHPPDVTHGRWNRLLIEAAVPHYRPIQVQGYTWRRNYFFGTHCHLISRNYVIFLP